MSLNVYPLTIDGTETEIPCLLSSPKEEISCAPTVIYFHGLNGSKKQVFQDRFLEFAETMKLLGCNLLSFDLRYHGDRREEKTVSSAQKTLKALTQTKRNPFDGAREDIHAITHYLLAKKIAKSKRIAITGLAWGGMHALHALTYTDLIRCGIVFLPTCKIADLPEFKNLAGHPLVKKYEPLNFVKNIAPKPLLMMVGEKDTRANAAHTSQLYEQLRDEYAHANAADHLAYSMIPGHEHTYSPRMTEMAVYWLKKHLLG